MDATEESNPLGTWDIREMRTLAEITKETGLPRSTLLNWHLRGILPVARLRNIYFTTPGAVQSAINQMHRKGLTP